MRERGLDGHRVADVALPQRVALACGPDRERATGRPAEQLGEQRRTVGSGLAEPCDAGVRAHERNVHAVRQQAVELDRRRGVAPQPVPAPDDEPREQLRDVFGARDARMRRSGPCADLDAEIAADQGAEGVLVSGVVAEVDDVRRAEVVPQAADRITLVRVDEGGVEHHLAVAYEHVVRLQQAPSLGHGGRLPVGFDMAVVERAAGRFRLDVRARERSRELREVLGELVSLLDDVGRELVGEIDVELRAVAPDEMDLRRQAAHQRQLAQLAAGDHGHVGLGEVGERAQCRDGLTIRGRRGRVVDDRRDRAVVVGGDEERRGARELVDGADDVGGDRHQPASSVLRKSSAHLCTSRRNTTARIRRIRWRRSAGSIVTACTIASFTESMS